MEIKTKKQPQNLIEIIVELSAEEVKPFTEQAWQELSKEVSIKGFRPGKAPLNLVKQEIEETKVLEKTAEKAINEKYPEILEKEQITPVAPPQIQIQKIAPDNPLIFKLTIPLLPKVSLGDYKKIKIKKEKVDVTEEEIKKSINQLQSMTGKEMVTEKPSQEKNKMKVDLDLFVDNVPLEGGQIRDFTFVVGEDQFLPGLSENLKGLKKGEEKTFTHQYPSDHYDKKLAGRLVKFKAKVKEVFQVDLPEINDDWAKSMGPFQSLEELKEKIKENILKEKEQRQNQKLEIELLEKIIADSDFEEIPDILIAHEIDKMIVELKGGIERPDDPTSPKFDDYLKSIKKTVEDLKKEFKPKAEQRIKTALVIKEIAQKENIKTEEDEVEEEIKNLEKTYQGQSKILENIKSLEGRAYLKNMITNEKVINWLKEQ
jgi:trigger factor